jgi:hypothetical protein
MNKVRDKKSTGKVFRSGCAHIAGRRRSQNNDTTNQQHVWNWRLVEGFDWSYNVCVTLEAKGYKMLRPPHNQPGRTYSKVLNEDIAKKG